MLLRAITAVVFLGLFLLRNRMKNTWKNRAHVVMAYPAFLILLLMAYIPMTGLILAFKTYDFTAGSFYTMPWADPIFKNFRVLSASKQLFYTMTRNTLIYYVLFTVIGTFLNIVLAIAIDQFVFKRVAKTMQTIMIIPIFVSYAAVTFIVYAFISPDTGIINQLMGTHIEYYKSSGVDYWPTILTIVKMWNSAWMTG